MNSPTHTAGTRNRFMPLYVGVAILAAVEAYVGLWLGDEGAPEMAQQAVLTVVPLVSIALMYLMLKSQE